MSLAALPILSFEITSTDLLAVAAEMEVSASAAKVPAIRPVVRRLFSRTRDERSSVDDFQQGAISNDRNFNVKRQGGRLILLGRGLHYHLLHPMQSTDRHYVHT